MTALHIASISICIISFAINPHWFTAACIALAAFAFGFSCKSKAADRRGGTRQSAALNAGAGVKTE